MLYVKRLNDWDYSIVDFITLLDDFGIESMYDVYGEYDKLYEDVWLAFNDSGTKLFVVYDDTKPVGFAMAQLDSLFMTKPFGYMNKFWIAPEARGTKAGRLLTEEVTKFFDENGVIHSFCTSTAGINQNKQFENLMRKYGFEPVGIAMTRKHE